MFLANTVFVSGPNSPHQNQAPYSYPTHVALYMDEYSEEDVLISVGMTLSSSQRGAFIGRLLV